MTVPESVSEPEEGVWIHFMWDNGAQTQSIHLREIDALRAVVSAGYGQVAFVPFGVDVSQATR